MCKYIFYGSAVIKLSKNEVQNFQRKEKCLNENVQSYISTLIFQL